MLLLCIFVTSALFLQVSAAGCSISTNADLGEPQPLIVDPADYSIKLPQKTDIVSFSANESMILSCPGSHLLVNVGDQKINLTSLEVARCVNGKQFSIGSHKTVFSNITCVQYPTDLARASNKTCEGGNQEIEIGFVVNNTFIRHLQICFDNRTHVTLYSNATITPSIRGRQSGFPRPFWSNDDFYNFGGNSTNKNADALYLKNNQIATLTRLLGFDSLGANVYINYTRDLYLARGHLTAKADKVYGIQQRLTFHMVNAAPQWQTLNGRNWANLEADARNLACDHDLVLQSYTGTYGVSTLPHATTQKAVELYLYADDKGNCEFPVPLLFWKFLYEQKTQSGIVFVGVNNPYLNDTSNIIICDDIYDTINWTTTFSRNNIANGIMYACDPGDFRKTVTYLPKLPIRRLLTFNSTFNTPSTAVSYFISFNFIFILLISVELVR